MIRKYIPLYIVFALFSILNISCVDLPKDVIAPSWDIALNFPVTDSTITLDEMIGDDSTLVASEDPQSLGLLYFQDVNIIDPIFVDSNLTIDGFSTETSQVLGDISINTVEPITQNILVTDWAPAVAPGDSTIFPESENELEIPFPKIDSFTYAVLDEGGLKIVIKNNLPVTIQLKGLKIKNAIGKQTVASHSTTVVIPPEGMDSLQFVLDGKTIEDSLYYVGTIYSVGSEGNIVVIPETAGTEIIGSFDDLVVSKVQAIVPEQEPFTTDDSYAFDDSIRVEKAIFKDGSFSLTFNNNIDIDINLSITINNLMKSDGTVFTELISLSRNETNRIVSFNNLSDWEIVTLSPGTPTNKINYSAIVSPVESDQTSLLSKTDSVSINVKFDEVALKHVEGLIAPVKFDIDETDFNFDLGDFQEKFNYNEFIWGNPGIFLTLVSSANMQIEVAGNLNGSTSSASNNLDFTLPLPGGGSSTFDLRNFGLIDFMNSFKDEIPNSFSFSGSATVNPNYISGSIENTDSVFGKINIEIPLNIGIAGGVFSDTLIVDSLDISDEEIDAINSITLVIELTNAIPVDLKISGAVLDEFNNQLFPFPPTYNVSPELIFNAPLVDDNGYVSEAFKSTQSVELRNEDAKAFISNPNLFLNIAINTSDSNNSLPVKFRNTDYINYKIYGKVNYRVNN